MESLKYDICKAHFLQKKTDGSRKPLFEVKLGLSESAERGECWLPEYVDSAVLSS